MGKFCKLYIFASARKCDPCLTICPKYLTLFCTNLQFKGLIFKFAFSKLSKTKFKSFKCASYEFENNVTPSRYGSANASNSLNSPSLPKKYGTFFNPKLILRDQNISESCKMRHIAGPSDSAEFANIPLLYLEQWRTWSMTHSRHALLC